MNATLHIPADRLRDARVVVIGLGGLGTPAVRALAACGARRLTLWDPDRVEASNLPRQVLYDDGDVGRRKTEVAATWLRERHPGLDVACVPRAFGPADAATLRDASVVLDGTDAIETKFAVSDACVTARVPLVHAGATALRAQLLTILPGRTACYRCVFEEPPPADDVPGCREAGVLAPLVVLAGTLQAAEAARIARDEPPAFAGRIVSIDAARGLTRATPVHPRSDCPACAPYAAEPMRMHP